MNVMYFVNVVSLLSKGLLDLLSLFKIHRSDGLISSGLPFIRINF